jgi:hypothetical protein
VGDQVSKETARSNWSGAMMMHMQGHVEDNASPSP